MIGNAVFDETRQYRYHLSREWMFGDGVCVFIMLNPSTADASVLDNTVRRCVRFAQRWGYKRLEVLNLFAWRSTDPMQLLEVEDPVGKDNVRWIATVTNKHRHQKIICAWGTHGRILDQGKFVTECLQASGVEAWCLGKNQDGSPMHPLYLPNDTELQRYV